MKNILYAIFFSAAAMPVAAQEHNASKEYVWPTDSLVVKKLKQWQDYKFGLLMHWGTYSQWGVVESWSICPEDEGWCERKGPYSKSYNEYVKAYENLQTTFNPTQFNPGKWADAAKDAGMKCVVFTTKHHDGFCMFDTKQTDYKITSAKTPFSTNLKSNVAKEVFNAFRKDSMMIGAYFSKPDWHCPSYWWPYFPAKDRNVNYEPAKHADKWNEYKQFTYNQIEELMTGYGSVDILWLDGGWVRPKETIDESVDWQKAITFNQDIDMANIIKMARTHQPGLISVDRTVSGPYENYVTPEQTIPAKPLDYPWESCITMGNSWSYVPNDHYKSTNELVHLLLKIVSRGGNFLLNIGPSPEGDFADTAYLRLKKIGEWMKVHGSAVYATKPLPPYEQDNIIYLQSKDEKTAYIFYVSKDGDEVQLPAVIDLNYAIPKGSKISLMDEPKTSVKLMDKDASHTSILLPGKKMVKGKYAMVFKVEIK